MKVIASHVIERVEELPPPRLLLHYQDGSTVEIEATGRRREIWLETDPGETVDLVRP